MRVQMHVACMHACVCVCVCVCVCMCVCVCVCVCVCASVSSVRACALYHQFTAHRGQGWSLLMAKARAATRTARSGSLRMAGSTAKMAAGATPSWQVSLSALCHSVPRTKSWVLIDLPRDERAWQPRGSSSSASEVPEANGRTSADSEQPSKML